MKKSNRYLTLLFVFLNAANCFSAPKFSKYIISSRDKQTVIQLELGTALQWSVVNGSDTLLTPSAISLHLTDGTVLGKNPRIESIKRETVNRILFAINYLKKEVAENYNQMTK